MPGKIIVKCTTARCDGYLTVGGTSLPAHTDLRTSIKNQSLNPALPRRIKSVVYLAGVSATADAPRLDAFRQALRDHGYIEGQNILIETRHEGRDLDRLPEHAAELVGQKPEVFVAVTTNAALAAKAAAAGADYADGYSNERKMGSLC